jgi:hypothetical protein
MVRSCEHLSIVGHLVFGVAEMPVGRISEFRMHSIGLTELDAIEARIDGFRGHADIAGH